MIYLIHGQNQVDSRRFLSKLKSNYQNIEHFSGKTQTSNEIKNFFSKISHPLFGSKSAVLIENFSGDWKSLPPNIPPNLDILLWSTQKILSTPNSVKNILFDKISSLTVFKLADAILYRREKEALIISAGLLDQKEKPEKIIGACARGIYLVYCAKVESLKNADLMKFARQKIEDQAKLWSKNSLRKALLQLVKLDLSLKEGLKAQPAFTLFISKTVSF